ncbi:PREDICTED: uncharacterized protein C15orf39 homolog, partial [Gekko japonicus]|uniref:Uncharacterized protein C15orf39 homolog n=1 Tax=Gekko japonicus TaxID=146911 RepID=A0ABM1JZW6_GEKJA
MAEKRRLEAVGAVAYSKLPRLEADPNHVHAAGLCRSGVLPGHASDGHYSYQGTYFGYPLQCHESPELSVHWSPAEPYVPCTDGGISQQLRPEKGRCMFYRQDSGGLGMWAQNPSYEKRKDCLVGDTLAAQEKWTNYSGHTDFIQQGWIQGYPMLHSSQVPAGCAPLLVPKPVYRNHVYCTDAGYSPKASPVPGMPAVSPSKRPTNVEWTPPSSGHAVNASCGSAAAKKGQVAESGFLPLPQSWKDAVAAPPGFSPYHKTFENLQVAPSASSVDASYPAGCKNRKSVPEQCAGSPCGKGWTKLPPPASPLAASQGLICQERSSACYPLPSYPLTSHEQLVLYNQSIAHAEKQKALFALPACKSFNFPAGNDPQLLPRTCFPPAPRSYYPGYLESDFYRAPGSPLVPSPGLKVSREHESQQNSHSKISFEHRNPISTCSVTERSSRGSSFPSREGPRDWPGADGSAEPANESFRCQRATPQPPAFQQLYSAERSPRCVDGYRPTQEAFYGTGPCLLEKGHSREVGPSYAEKQSGLSSEDKKRDPGKPLQSGACIVIPDSPVASHDPCLKGDSRRSRISERSDSLIQQLLQSPDKEPRDLKRTEAPLSPSSPPMPVIHNVFSLAPYREYLEGSAVSLRPPSLEGCPAEKSSSAKSWQKAGGTTSPRPPSAASSKTPGASLDQGKDIACNAAAEGSRKDPSGSCIVPEKESRGYPGFCENYRGCQNAPATSSQGATGCASEFAKEDHALDLSLKTEGLPDVLRAQGPAGKPESLERENGKIDGESVKEDPAKGQEVIQESNPPASQPPQKNRSGEKSNFQSSAAFLYKKFKILKPRAAGPGSTTQQNFLFQSNSQIDALSNNASLQRDSKQAATQQNHLPVPQSSQPVVTQQNYLPVQHSFQLVVFQQNHLSVQQSSQQVVTQQNHLPVQQSSQWVVTQQNGLPVQQSCLQAVTQQNSLPVQQSCQQAVTRQNSLPVQQSSQQVVTQQHHLPVQQSSQQVVTQQHHLPVQQSSQQVVTQQHHLPVQQSSQQVVTQQHHLPVQQSSQWVVTQQNGLPAQQSGQQVVTRQNSLPVQQSCQQAVTRQNSLPVQQSFQQMVTRRNSLPALHIVHEKSAKPNAQHLSRKCRKQPDTSKLPLLDMPAGSPALGEVSASLPPSCKSPTQHPSPKQYFTALHASVCAAISDSVSTSSPELLREWLEKAEPERKPKSKAAVPAKAKSGPKTPEAPKPSKAKRVWLASKDTAGLLKRLQSRLETFLLTRECPFPNVVRAGAIFIPIHVVKEQLFGNLPGASVDHVLQAHKVELRPTTLTEEKLLRERDLKTCTSRMLKLLALKQLPDIYPDLLDLHWHHCVKQQLGEPAEEIWSEDLEAAGVSRCLQSASQVLSPGVRGKH